MRIVSLLPSSTEIVCALGLEGSLVGRSHECDFPSSIRSLPVLTAPRVPLEGSSEEIDRTVKGILGQGLAIYRVDPDRLKQVAPQVILTQIQCEVCAVSPREVEEALTDWVGHRPRLITLAPNTLQDVLEDILRVARDLDVRSRGEHLVGSMMRRLNEFTIANEAIGKRPRVLLVEWISPLMAAGNWMPALVLGAGGQPLFGQDGKPSSWLEWKDVVEGDPDVIVVMPCGFDIPRTLFEMEILTRLPGWSSLRAVSSGHVFVTDGNQFFNRPGPRLVVSLEILAEILHPDRFRFGHEGANWLRYQGPATRPPASGS